MWDETESVFFDEMRQNQIFFQWDETEPGFIFMRWDRIRFYFHEMRQNQILFSWNKTKSEIFSWNEMKQKTETVLMKQDWVFVKQDISSWFFDQSKQMKWKQTKQICCFEKKKAWLLIQAWELVHKKNRSTRAAMKGLKLPHLNLIDGKTNKIDLRTQSGFY